MLPFYPMQHLRPRTTLFLLLTACVAACELRPPAADVPDTGVNIDAGPDTTTDRDGDGTPDYLDCEWANPVVHPGAFDSCDTIDTDCNGVVDDGAGVVHQPVYYDHDLDGDVWPGRTEPNGCVREHWVAGPVELDCNEFDPDINAASSDLCDWDLDGYTTLFDCNDHDRDVHPGVAQGCSGIDNDCDGTVDDADVTPPFGYRPVFGIDADGDGYPSEFVERCASPGGAYVPTAGEIDCAPDDPLVHPNQPDDCDNARDTNCDGVFSPVYGGSPAFTASGPSDPPMLARYFQDVLLCPGTYRVYIGVGTFPGEFGGSHEPVSIRGLGASPSDVVLDAGGAFPNAIIRNFFDLDQNDPIHTTFTNLTFANGLGDQNGCIEGLLWGQVTLDNVVFSGCMSR